MKRVLWGFLVAVLTVGLLAACYKGEVKKKDPDRNGSPSLLVDDGTRERWVKVDKATFERCAIGEWYQDDLCRESKPILPHMDEVPAPDPNDPHRNPGVEDKDKKIREVCVAATMTPAVKTDTVWAIGWESAGPETYTADRFGPRCRKAESGTKAFILVQKKGNASIVHCQIYTYIKGDIRVLNEHTTGMNLHDCDIEARVP